MEKKNARSKNPISFSAVSKYNANLVSMVTFSFCGNPGFSFVILAQTFVYKVIWEVLLGRVLEMCGELMSI